MSFVALQYPPVGLYSISYSNSFIYLFIYLFSPILNFSKEIM